jgi:hypothetical protein
MPSALPHNEKIRLDLASYLAEAVEFAKESVDRLTKSGDFRAIYKTCLATDSVLAKLSRQETPRLKAARSLVRRIPLLIVCGQTDVARGQLRCLIEIAFWCVYFTDHPVEWEEFQNNPTLGIATSISEPIRYCAHRERRFYSDYATELLSVEPSHIATRAVQELTALYADLNRYVHGGHALLKSSLHPVLDDSAELPAFSKTLRTACANTCIVLSAFLSTRFDTLPAVHREWFDWLVSLKTAKKIRAGKFGIRRG